MNILCFDTATDACSVALQVGDVHFARHEIVPRLHAQLLLPMIQSIILDAKITLSELDAIAFGCGPGSFMGIRLATGMAQGLAFGLSVPVIPISTLQVIAQTAYEKTGEKKIISGWDARMQEVYWGKYECDENNVMQSQQEDALCTAENIDRDSFAALGFAFAGNIFSDDTYPSAVAMLTIAKQKYLNKDIVSPENAHPHYVRHHVVHTHK
jgi:tRNA threonylcarbamoyladenosine biosynthesis protein TsaB